MCGCGESGDDGDFGCSSKQSLFLELPINVPVAVLMTHTHKHTHTHTHTRFLLSVNTAQVGTTYI